MSASASGSSSSSSSTYAGRTLVIDPFALRQFTDPNYTGTKINYDVEKFEAKVNEFYKGDESLHEGYAPFCKHLFIPNFADVPGSIVPITAENESLIRSGYEARKEKELPVLVRWFPMGSVPLPQARFLDIILYSREQIRKENEAMGDTCASDAPWGIISVKAQDVDHEVPMQPITMLRNALGRDQGGSGVPLDASKYRESVEFWAKHATIK